MKKIVAAFVMFLLIGASIVTVVGIQNDIKKYDEDYNNLMYIKIFEQPPNFEHLLTSDAYYADGIIVYENLWGIDDDIVKLTWWGCPLKMTSDGWINGTPEGMNFFIFFYGDSEEQSNAPPNELIKSFDFSAEDIEITYTGEYYKSSVSGRTYELIKFDCLLPSPISLSDGNGWISIQSYNDIENDCFLWMASSGGDNFSYQVTTKYPTIYDWDVSICFYRLNEPPEEPTITGDSSGKPGTEYEYSFVSTDPEEDEISYFIDWGDNSTTDWASTLPSGEYYNSSHIWSEEGNYTIKAKAKDIYGAESDWATITVTMPKNKSIIFNSPLVTWILERFPIFEKILNQLL